MKKFIIALLFLLIAVPAQASEVKLSNDGTCLIKANGGNESANCTWYLKNYYHMLDDWYLVVNDAIKKEITKVQADKEARAKSLRDANRLRAKLILKAK